MLGNPLAANTRFVMAPQNEGGAPGASDVSGATSVTGTAPIGEGGDQATASNAPSADARIDNARRGAELSRGARTSGVDHQQF
jgi:hypothetical protein